MKQFFNSFKFGNWKTKLVLGIILIAAAAAVSLIVMAVLLQSYLYGGIAAVIIVMIGVLLYSVSFSKKAVKEKNKRKEQRNVTTPAESGQTGSVNSIAPMGEPADSTNSIIPMSEPGSGTEDVRAADVPGDISVQPAETKATVVKEIIPAEDSFIRQPETAKEIETPPTSISYIPEEEAAAGLSRSDIQAIRRRFDMDSEAGTITDEESADAGSVKSAADTYYSKGTADSASIENINEAVRTLDYVHDGSPADAPASSLAAIRRRFASDGRNTARIDSASSRELQELSKQIREMTDNTVPEGSNETAYAMISGRQKAQAPDKERQYRKPTEFRVARTRGSDTERRVAVPGEQSIQNSTPADRPSLNRVGATKQADIGVQSAGGTVRASRRNANQKVAEAREAAERKAADAKKALTERAAEAKKAAEEKRSAAVQGATPIRNTGAARTTENKASQMKDKYFARKSDKYESASLVTAQKPAREESVSETSETPVNEQKKNEDYIKQYSESRIKSLFKIHKINKENTPVIIDSCSSLVIDKCPAFCWFAKDKMNFLLLESEPRTVSMPMSDFLEVTYRKGVEDKSREAYRRLDTVPELKEQFSGIIPLYYAGSSAYGRSVLMKNLYILGRDMAVTPGSLKQLMKRFRFKLSIFDSMTDPGYYSDSFKQAYEAKTLWTDTVISQKEYQNRIRSVLQSMTDDVDLIPYDFEEDLKRMVYYRLITDEYADFYRTKHDMRVAERIQAAERGGKRRK